MKLNYILLCDSASLSIDRKVNIIGVFESINAPKLPVVHPKFTVVGSIEPDKSQFSMSIDIVDKNNTSTMGDTQKRDINLPVSEDGKLQNFNFIVEIVNSEFTKSGPHYVVVKINDTETGRVPLNIISLAPDNKGPKIALPN